MSILKDYFDKIYCINLDRRVDRWEKVSKVFNELGFDDVERYVAIEGKSLDLINLNYKPSLLLGELGLIETHINIIKEAIEKDYKSILIMEDDVYFTPEVEKFAEYMSEVPKDWDMIYIGGNHTYGIAPEVVTDKILKLNKTYTTHCIAIKKSVFETILAIAVNRQKQIDVYYADLQVGHNVYGFTPNMALQTIDFSDIQGRTVDYTNFFK